MCRGKLDDPEEPLDPLPIHANTLLICYAAVAYIRPFVTSRGSGAKFLTLGQLEVVLEDEFPQVTMIASSNAH